MAPKPRLVGLESEHLIRVTPAGFKRREVRGAPLVVAVMAVAVADADAATVVIRDIAMGKDQQFLFSPELKRINSWRQGIVNWKRATDLRNERLPNIFLKRI